MKKLIKSDLFSRQSLIFKDEDYNIPVKILWTWFIWSNLAMTFARTWFKNLFLVDFDKVNQNNLLNQVFKVEDLWNYKVDSLKQNIEDSLSSLTDVVVYTFPNKIEELFNSWIIANSNEIIVVATDNLESRINFAKEILKTWDKNNWYQNTLFLFINTSWEVIYLWTTSWDKEFFRNLITELSSLTKDDISEWLCWEKSSFYLWNLVSWYMISEVRCFLNKKTNKFIKETLFGIKANRFKYNFTWFWKKKYEKNKKINNNEKTF